MKIISWNTNGLRATVKQGNFLPLFKKHQPDILCLQETKSEPSQLTDEVLHPVFQGKTLESYFNYPKTKKGYSGVAIYTRLKPKEVFYGMGVKKLDDEGRILGLKFDKFTLITGYYPNGGAGPGRLKYKLEFYDAFLKFILKLRQQGEQVIFCGDVNTAHHEIDLARPKENVENTGFLPIERAWLDKVVANGFIDVYRHFYPNQKDAYTYWDQKTRARDRNVGWRLDYFFVDKKLVPKIKKTEVLSDYPGSDHCPISIDIVN